jgi:transposase
MKKLGELMMILNLHRQGVKLAVIARQVGVDRKTVRKYIARGVDVPTYGPRQPRERLLDPYIDYLRARLEAYPGLSAQRLARELGERGYTGGYSTVRDTVRSMRRAGGGKPYAVRFETPPGHQAQVDFAQFRVRFADAPDRVQVVWLFSMVLGFSRLIWGRFVLRQTMPSVLACHRAAFEAIGGVPREILYDRMKTAVIGEDEDGRVVYNRTLGEFAKHYGYLPKACRAYRPETKGKVERPFRYIREDFFLGGMFHDLDDLNAQFNRCLSTVANEVGTSRTDGKRIKLPIVGWVRMPEAVRFTGKLKRVTVRREADRWFASIMVETDDIKPVEQPCAAVGVDLGIKTLAVLSDGSEIEGPKHRALLQRLRRASRSLSRKRKGSANRRKAKAKLARLHARISHVRKDATHKLTTMLAKTYRRIAIEDLNVRGMARNRCLARSIMDGGF